MDATPLTLSAAQAEFIIGPLSIYAASSNSEGQASMSRVLACLVDDARRKVTLLLHPLQAAALLRDIAASGRIAAVFNEPASHKTLQLKSSNAQIVSAPPDAEALAQAHVRDFAAAVNPAGFTSELVQAILRGTPGPLAAVRFAPQACFEQTPGPKAGVRV